MDFVKVVKVKIENLISKVLFKAAPMSNMEHAELTQQMGLWFETKKAAVDAKIKEGKPLTLVEKGLSFIDQWYMRALFAMSYIFIVKWIQDILNPAEPDDEEGEDLLSRR